MLVCRQVRKAMKWYLETRWPGERYIWEQIDQTWYCRYCKGTGKANYGSFLNSRLLSRPPCLLPLTEEELFAELL